MTLLENLKDARKKEKSATYIVLKYLAQVKKQKLHLKLGYSSLYKFLIKELTYSEGEAVARISALKLMMNESIIESRIKSGEMNLSKAAKISNLLDKYDSKIKKSDLIAICEKVKDKSVRYTEDVVSRHLNIPKPKLKNIILNESQIDKLNRARELYGDISDAELIEILLTEKLNENLPLKEVRSKVKVSRYIPKKVRHAAFTKSNHQCQFYSKSGKRCNEKRFLELDHIKPYSKNGLNNLENIQVLCSNHNKLKGSF